MRTIAALCWCLQAGAGVAQTVSLDNVPPIALLSSPSSPAMGLDPVTGNVTVRSASGQLATCSTGVGIAATEKVLLAGNTGLVINNSPAIALANTQPVTYLNRSVADGRRVLSLRVAQPLLCVDFSSPPSAASNPVALQYTDPNQDTTPLLFGGISVSRYFTNGAAASSLQLESGAELACCTMAPAANAACYAGTPGGTAPDALFRDGFENAAAIPLGGAPDLAVTVTGPSTLAPGSNLNYSVTVTNQGGTQINGVRVRDWYPKPSGGTTATLSAGSWACSAAAGSSCGSTSGSGNILADAVSLGPNSSVSYSISRALAPSANLGSVFSVSAAAFAPPLVGETALADNQQAREVTVLPPAPTCTPIHQQVLVQPWNQVTGGFPWPAFGQTSRITIPGGTALAVSFVPGAQPMNGRYRTFPIQGFPTKITVSTSPGCFLNSEVAPNCASLVDTVTNLNWSTIPGQPVCALVPGQTYYLNIAVGDTIHPPSGVPTCQMSTCVVDLLNDPL